MMYSMTRSSLITTRRRFKLRRLTSILQRYNFDIVIQIHTILIRLPGESALRIIRVPASTVLRLEAQERHCSSSTYMELKQERVRLHNRTCLPPPTLLSHTPARVATAPKEKNKTINHLQVGQKRNSPLQLF